MVEIVKNEKGIIEKDGMEVRNKRKKMEEEEEGSQQRSKQANTYK